MIRTIADVIRGEGLASAWRRARERLDEAFQNRFPSDGEIVNDGSLSARTGGIAVQLAARLRLERHLRRVAVSRELPIAAKVIHLEGTFGVPVDRDLVVSLHDTTLTDRRLLDAARGVIVASPFLRDFYGVGEVVEPAIPAAPVIPSEAKEVAFAGAVKRHKGGHLLPELARLMASRRLTLHVFGGGDVDLLQALRRERNVIVHGYYRAVSLPALLSRQRIGLVVVPSVVAEGYCMTLSEAWLAGAAVAAFDLGAQAERIRRLGGGWLTPLASGAAGLMEIIDQWHPIDVPQVNARPIDAARAHVALYRRWGVMRQS